MRIFSTMLRFARISRHSLRYNSSFKVYPKINDISHHVYHSIKSDETLSVFEDAVTYLKEIAPDEDIPQKELNYHFNKWAAQIFEKKLKSASTDDISSFISILDQNSIYSKPYYTILAQKLVESENITENLQGFVSESGERTLSGSVVESKSGEQLTGSESAQSDSSIHQRIVSLWVASLEADKKSFKRSIKTIDERDFRNLAFFSFIILSLKENIPITPESINLFLDSDILPPTYWVKSTLDKFAIAEKFKSDYYTFRKKIEEIYKLNTDPNDASFLKKFNQCVESRNLYRLKKLWKEINDLAEQQGKTIDESQCIRIMNAFYDIGDVDQVFSIFSSMVENGIENPKLESWEIILKSLGSMKNIKSKSPQEKITLIQTINNTVATLEASNKITAKTIAIIVGTYGNLKQFDKVDDILNKYTVQGTGKFPLIAPIKNNIIMSYLLNKDIVQAEAKLKEFMEDGEFVPLTTLMNSFLDFYSKNGKYDNVEKVFEYMKENNIKENIATYTIIIDVYFKLHRQKGLVPDVDAILKSLLESKDIEVKDVTFTTLIDGLARDGSNIEAARSMYATAKKRFRSSAQLHTSMLKSELDHGSLILAQEIFEWYTKNISNDSRIWNLLINGLLARDDALALNFYQQFKSQTDYNAKPNFYTWYYLLNHFVTKNNNVAVQTILDDLSSVKYQDLGSQIPKLLVSLKSEYKLSPQLLEGLSKRGS